jgi:ribosome-binding factor A
MATERRIERLQKEILRELSRVLREELNDPRMGMITLTRVRLSPDLKVAKVSVSALGGEAEWRRSFAAIRHALGFIQKTLGGRLSTRYVPELLFRYDKSIEGAIRVHKIIDDLAKERVARTAAAPEEAEETAASEETAETKTPGAGPDGEEE